MSVQALAWALDQPIDSHGAKLLLITLANYADERGHAWPGQSTLASHVRADRKSIIRWLQALERDGYLSVERRGGEGAGRKPNRYRLALPLPGQSPNRATLGKVPPAPPAKSQPDPGKVPPVTQEPLAEPSEEPSAGTGNRARPRRDSRTATARAARLSLASLPEDWRRWATQHRPELDPVETWEEFRDYWIAQPGQKGTKLDWFATWRNWCRRQRPYRNTHHERLTSRAERIRDTAQDMLRRGKAAAGIVD